MTEPLISIIIPVYNPGKYFEPCMESILEQDTSECEVILIDDGSTDGSGESCDKYAERNKNVIVYHQQNFGAAAARNEGIRIAKGGYIVFADSDDLLVPDALETMYREVRESEAEIVFFKVFKLFSDGSSEVLGDDIERTGFFRKEPEEMYEYLASRPRFPDAAWGKAFSRPFILENKIFFESGLLYEDVDWMTKALFTAKRFSASDIPVYYYRKSTEGSASKSTDPKCAWDTLKIMKRWVGTVGKKSFYSEREKMVLSFMAFEFPILVSLYDNVEPERKADMKKALKEYAWVQKYRNTAKNNLSRLSYSLFGPEFTCKLMNLYFRSRKI